MSSNFEKVVDFNKQFGVTVYDSPQRDIITREPNNVEYCIKLIREEVGELEHSVQTNYYTEVVNAVADILYVVYGM